MEIRDVNIGKMIRFVITEKGISQAELGRKLNKSPIYVARLLKRKTTDTSTLNSLCVALGYNFFMEYTQTNENKEKFRLSYPHIGNLIFFKMRENMISQSEIGRILGTTPQEISRLLKNESINTGKLFRLSKCLGFNFFQEFYRHTSADEEKIICPFIEFLGTAVKESGFCYSYIRSVIRDYLNEVEPI